MQLRLSDRERQYLQYLNKTNPKEFRGSWQQELRHLLDKHMIKDTNKDDNPFKFDYQKAVAYHKEIEKRFGSTDKDDKTSSSADTDK